MILIYMLLAAIFLAVAYVIVKKDNYVETPKAEKTPSIPAQPKLKKVVKKKITKPSYGVGFNTTALDLQNWSEWCREVNKLGMPVSSYGRNMKDGVYIMGGKIKFEFDPCANTSTGKSYEYLNKPKNICETFDNLEDFIKYYNAHLTELKEQIAFEDMNKDFD